MADNTQRLQNKVDPEFHLRLIALLLLLEDIELDSQVGVLALGFDVPHDLQQLQSWKEKMSVEHKIELVSTNHNLRSVNSIQI